MSELKYHWTFIRCAGLWICLLICGCGRSPAPSLGTVTGQVTLDGKPLESALVMFQPERGRASSGWTDRTGRYQLVYTRQSKGALPGKHVVNIRTHRENGDGNVVVREFLPPRYHDQTELAADVTAGKNVINFELKSQ